MVLNKFSHLARHSLSKNIPHGSAQSLVAASQSSCASTHGPYLPFGNQNSNKNRRSHTAQFHTAFQNVSAIPASASKAASTTADPADGTDVLNPYYEAWRKHQQHGEEGKEWKQFQFVKRIGWKSPSVAPDAKGKELSHLGSRPNASLDRGGLDPAYSTSAVDDIRKTEDVVVETTAIVNVDEAIANEIIQFQQYSVPRNESQSISISALLKETNKQITTVAVESTSPSSVLTSEDSAHSALLSDNTAATSRQEPEVQTFSDHISKLYEQESYGQIPSVFRSMLEQDLRPTVKDYNALLAAAINHPVARHQVVPKALDVYADMLRRKVSPDTTFYTTLIQLLSRRALDVSQMKTLLNKKRLRFSGLHGNRSFLFASNEAEYAILAEDDALYNAVKIFYVSTSMKESRLYSAETYQLLVRSCAVSGLVEDMIRVYNQMELQKVKPIASMFPPMIEAFAKAGDLISAVDCYNEYKQLAIADNAGKLAMIDRKDNEIYAALVKAYAICGKNDGARRFFGKIVDANTESNEYRRERLEAVQDIVVLDALVEERLLAIDFAGAFKIAEEYSLTPHVRTQTMTRICVDAADHGDVHYSTKAYQYMTSGAEKAPAAAILSMLSLNIRRENLDAASEYWALLTSSAACDASLVEPTSLYAIALIRDGRADEGVMKAREGFRHIRVSVRSAVETTEQIDEAIEVIGAVFSTNGLVPSPKTSISFLWAMIENGGLVSPVAEQMLAVLGPEDINSLSWQDMVLALQVEADLLGNAEISHDVAHSARFTHLLDIAVDSGAILDERTNCLIEKALIKIAPEQPAMADKWQRYQQSSVSHAGSQREFTPQLSPAVASNTSFANSYDPYTATTDYRGSTVIAEELELRRNSAGLNEALQRFRNIRRAGRHPRYIVYAKLISAAAKEGRTNLIHDVLGMARTDMPFVTQYPVVRHGWASILDSMVGACLTLGRRDLATQFHQEMLDMGTAPTANTFGLYITTLKDSAKSFDEASEAVSIFRRAISEGVTPSSFLYNALIGKLGKARRIDDCLRYFQEMRAAGIRPTSVTYGTVVNALCRVSDDRFAEELFEEMETMPNYKPRPAPYNSLMQYFLTTKRDSSKVLSYYKRMQSRNIEPTMHTYKLLIDTYATLEPIDLAAAEGIFDTIRAAGQRPEAVHYASLIHAKGCALHDMAGARHTFDQVLFSRESRPQACLYQALFESMVANHCVVQTEEVLDSMSANGVEITPYIANTLIHGWAMENDIAKAKAVYDSVCMERREPSTYEAMTRAFLTVQDRDGALVTVHEMLSRGYPSAVSSKILELIGHGST